jgi:hypothetical protein
MVEVLVVEEATVWEEVLPEVAMVVVWAWEVQEWVWVWAVQAWVVQEWAWVAQVAWVWEVLKVLLY